jgi:hypothetical protein
MLGKALLVNLLGQVVPGKAQNLIGRTMKHRR